MVNLPTRVLEEARALETLRDILSGKSVDPEQVVWVDPTHPTGVDPLRA